MQKRRGSSRSRGAPTPAGRMGAFGVNPRNGLVEIQNANNVGIINGHVSAIAHNYVSNAVDTSLKWSSAFSNKRILLDATIGWHHEEQGVRASDGTALGSGQGLSNVSKRLRYAVHPQAGHLRRASQGGE